MSTSGFTTHLGRSTVTSIRAILQTPSCCFLIFSFSDPFQLHHERMRQMMGGFSDPFGQGFMPSITDGRHRGHRAAAQPNIGPSERSGQVSLSKRKLLISLSDCVTSLTPERVIHLHTRFIPFKMLVNIIVSQTSLQSHFFFTGPVSQ